MGAGASTEDANSTLRQSERPTNGPLSSSRGFDGERVFADRNDEIVVEESVEGSNSPLRLEANSKALWFGVGVGFIGVAASFYYYLKVIRAIYWRPATSEKEIPVPRISRIAILSLTGLTILFGFWPNPIIWVIGS